MRKLQKLFWLVSLSSLIIGGLLSLKEFKINLQLLDCFADINKDAGFLSKLCFSLDGMTASPVTPWSLWHDERYQQLATTCGPTLCSCFEDQTRSPFYQAYGTYYAVISYYKVNQNFPLMDECVNNFVPSNFLWRQALEYLQKDNVENFLILQELAYLVDNGWQDDWDRGLASFKQAKRYQSSGDLDAATNGFMRGIESLHLSDDDRANSYLAWSYYHLGEIYFEQDLLEESIEAYINCVLTSPKYAPLRSYEAIAKIRLQQSYDKEYIYKQFEFLRTQVDPDNPYITFGAIKAFIAIDCLSCAKQFIDGCPTNIREAAVLDGSRAVIAQEEGHFQTSIEFYEKALKKSKDDKEFLEAAGWADSIAKIYQQLGDLTKAYEYMQIAVELHPEAALYWYRLSEIHVGLENFDAAYLAIHAAIEIDPDNQTYIDLAREVAERREQPR
jgi:tetratricopeptide (TPR) repeat protein